MSLQRVRAQWNGFAGAPGVSTFYVNDASTFLPALRQWFAELLNHVPSGISVQIENVGDIVDVPTGNIVGTWNADTVAVANGTMGGAYAGPVGCQVNWLTAGILNGRRLRGKTFIVPLASEAFDLNGQVNASIQAAFETLAATLIAAAPQNMVVYSRPRDATPQWSDATGHIHAAKPARSGASLSVTTGVVSRKAVVLRSRRD